MLFYPIYYNTVVYKGYNTIVIVCYDEHNNRMVIRMRYPYSFYISDIGVREANEISSKIDGNICVCEKIEKGRSTKDPMKMIDAIRIDCDNKDTRDKVIRIFQNHGAMIHETNNVLTPLLKMLQEKDVFYYSWMEVEVEETSDNISLVEREYIGDVSTLKLYDKVLPPPHISIFSFDLECNSVDWDVMCDASTSMENDIKVACITYVHGNTYKEYCICYGPDIKDIWKRFNDEDVRVVIAKSELHLIQLLFACIEKFDPDIIIGHNIAGFDIPYIITRYRLLCMRNRISVDIPNISRFKDVVIAPYSVEWNNSQVSMSGKLLHVPGRIWIDTLILAARKFLGDMENNKLDTLAKVHLGMSKNDVSHKDMFAWFDIWNRIHSGENSEKLDYIIEREYEIGLRKYNKELPPMPDTISIDHINTLVNMINVMNQRGDRMRVYTKKDGLTMDKTKVYNDLRDICQSYINKWNIPRVDDKMDKIKTLWWIVARYCVHDTRIPYRIIALQNMISVLMEQSNIFCVSINDILCRGQMFAVTSSQYRKARSLSYLVDLVERGDPSDIDKVGGGYVGKGKPGLKILDDDSIIIVLDFKSLYPTIIISNNICYTTWVPYEKRGKEVTSDMCNIIYVDDLYDEDTGKKLPDREHWFLKKEILPGIVPSMLAEQYRSRDSIKGKMKNADASMKVVYNAQQLAVKAGMNSAYGAFGTIHSYICNKACADATTAMGRKSILKVNSQLECMGYIVVYNDTDSAMVLISEIKKRFDNDVAKIKKFSEGLATELSKFFPDPMQLECENYFLAFFLRGPKMYTAIKWDTISTDLKSYGMAYIEANQLLYIKGLASVRKDKYMLYKIIYNKILELILMKYDISIVGSVLEKYIVSIWNIRDSYKDPLKLESHMSYNIGISPKAVNGSGTTGQWISRYEKFYKRKPMRGERFKVLICDGINKDKHTKSADKMHTLDWMTRSNHKLDIDHYLLCFESKGGIFDLINIAYDNPIPRNAMRDYYLPKLRKYGRLDVVDE